MRQIHKDRSRLERLPGAGRGVGAQGTESYCLVGTALLFGVMGKF